METNEVATTQQGTDVIIFDDSEFEIGAEQNVGKNDVLIPKLLLMQGQSPKVLDPDTTLSFGDITNTLNWEVMGSPARGKQDAKKILYTPFHWEKFWIYKKQDGQRFVFDYIEKMTSATENLDMYEEWMGDDGLLRKRVYLHLFYVLIEGQPIPYTIGFRGGSKQAGDALVTQMFTINPCIKAKEAWRKSPMAKQMELSVSITKNNDGDTFAVYETKAVRDSTLQEALEALKWNKAVRSGEAKADHSDLEAEGEAKPTGEQTGNTEY